ncbi:MAG: DUF3307 domain-containing protein [Patescibacteria group bacterium]
MTLFEKLFLAHMIGDWMLQTEYMATYKARGSFFNRALISHCVLYCVPFTLLTCVTSLKPTWLALLFASHMLIDRRWPVEWWIHVVMRTSTDTLRTLPWLIIVVDQVMHIIVLMLIARTSL